jgi:uncharacterized BrkB/YihY/UPF0761 family membrane protein
VDDQKRPRRDTATVTAPGQGSSVAPVREEPAPALSRAERRQLRAAAWRARATQLSERAEAERDRHASVDCAFEIVDRDVEVGGGIISGALAYRLFIWLLPFALVLVAGLGIASDAASTTPEAAASSLGIAGLVTASIAEAASGQGRWYALLVGVPILLYATRSLLRALIGVHRLVWTDLRSAAPRPTVGGTLRLLGIIFLFMAVSVLAGAVRSATFWGGLVLSLVLVVPYTGLWLLVSLRLPHRDAEWRWLLPGALLFAVGIELVHVVTAYFIAPLSLSKEGTYGALGIASALLLALYFGGRVIVAAAALNATLWDRHVRAERVKLTSG